MILMIVRVGPNELLYTLDRKSTLFNTARNLGADMGATANGYEMHLSKYLTIEYPLSVTVGLDGAPIMDDGREIAEEAEDMLGCLGIDSEYVGVLMFVGRFKDGDGDLPSRFTVQADKTATHVMLLISSITNELMPSQRALDEFCKKNHADLYLQLPGALHQLCILPINGDIIQHAVWHIWKMNLEESAADVQRLISNKSSDSRTQIIKDEFDDRLKALNAGPMRTKYHFVADQCACKISLPDLHAESFETFETFDCNTDAGLYGLMSAIILSENISHPMADFYGQKKA